MDTEQLPAYSATPQTDGNTGLTQTNLPNQRPPPAPVSFTIGAQTLTQPLVTVDQVKTHLSLLRAFRKLKATVQESDAQSLNLPELVRDFNKDKRWTWFVGLAVERFQRWLGTIAPATNLNTWIERNFPPVDVLMVWHSYLLNPSRFLEDTERLKILNGVRIINDKFLAILDKVVNVSGYQPSLERMGEWHKATGIPFDPLESLTSLSHRVVECPFCEEKVSVPLITAEATGYLQPQFLFQCTGCHLKITKENLAIGKFARDLLDSHDENFYRPPYGEFISGTLFSPMKLKDPFLAQTIQETILADPLFVKPSNTRNETGREVRDRLLVSSGGSMAKIKATLLKRLIVGRAPRTEKIMSAYIDDRPFSVELVGAVIRQGSFVDKMGELGWTNPSYFDSATDEVALLHAIARYHAFLDLLGPDERSFFIPTLDIDLVWHTHQMLGLKYGVDTRQYVKRFIDHNDQVEEGYLSTSFDTTCRAWQKRFGIPYIHCGCPLPGDTIGKRLGSLTKIFKSSSNPLSPLDRPDSLLATHPSDHDCVPYGDPKTSEHKRQKRIDNANKRRERDAELVKKGKLSQEYFQRGEAHQQAFLYPVPIYLPPVANCSAMSQKGYVDTSSSCNSACGTTEYAMVGYDRMAVGGGSIEEAWSKLLETGR